MLFLLRSVRREAVLRPVLFILLPFVLSFAGGLISLSAAAQSYQHINDCTRSINSQTQAMQQDDSALMVSSARWFLSNCRDLMRGPDDEAGVPSELAKGLIQQDNFEDALPILNRCVTIKPDAAFCFVDLGEALFRLARMQDARSAYQKAISIGGYDNVNAAAIQLAHQGLELLASLESETSSSRSEREKDSASSPSRFGTGFYVSTVRQILTNNHVVDGCRVLSTGDGKQLRLQVTNVICLQPNDAKHKEYGHDIQLDTSLPKWNGWYAFRRGIATEVTAATKDVLAAKGLLRHSSVSTTMAHYIKDVPEATLRGMEQIEALCSNREVSQPERSKSH